MSLRSGIGLIKEIDSSLPRTTQCRKIHLESSSSSSRSRTKPILAETEREILSPEKITNVIVIQTITKRAMAGAWIEKCWTVIVMIIIHVHRGITKLIVIVIVIVMPVIVVVIVIPVTITILILVTKRDVLKERIVIIHICGVDLLETTAINIRDQKTTLPIEPIGDAINLYPLI